MEELVFEDLDQYLINQKGKIIHQIWFGIIPTKKKAKKTFKKLKKYRDSWIIKNPNWIYMCWNLEKCNNLIKLFYNSHMKMYNSYEYFIQKCDVIRYFILHRYGGLYTDMDYYCNRSFDQALKIYKNDIYFVETPNSVGTGSHISNSLMYSKPNHNFWKKVFVELEMHKKAPYYYSRHMTIMFTTGPGILNRIYNKYKILLSLEHLPYKLFHPYGITSDIKMLKNIPSIFAVHIGYGSWETNDSKIFLFLYKEWRLLLFIMGVLIIPNFIKYIIHRKITNN